LICSAGPQKLVPWKVSHTESVPAADFRYIPAWISDKFQVCPIAKEGNCWFDCVEFQIPNSKSLTIRSFVCDFTERNLDTELNYRLYFDDPLNAHDQLNELRKGGKWSTSAMDIVVMSTAAAFNLNLVVHTPKASYSIPAPLNPEDRRVLTVWLEWNHYSFLCPKSFKLEESGIISFFIIIFYLLFFFFFLIDFSVFIFH